MREQFWGFLWGMAVLAHGPHHRASRWLESKWSAAYWATQPPLNSAVCSAACEARHG